MNLLRAFHSHAAWPPPLLIVGFILLYGGFNAAIWLVETLTDYPTSDLPEIVRWRTVVLQLAMIAHAIFRLGRFHPACNRSYAGWLRLSPWTPDKPLPLGPIYPVWQDVVVVGIIAATAKWHAGVDPTIAPLAFGFGYLASMTLLLARTGRWVAVTALGFLWPALMLPSVKGWLQVVIVLAMVVLTWVGHRYSLRAFPWPWVPLQVPAAETSLLQMNISIPSLNQQQLRTTAVGWPLASISPKFDCPSISLRTALGISAVVSWWLYCLLTRSSEDPLLPETIVWLGMGASFFRLLFYCGSAASPLSIFGRLALGRLIIPRYDIIFVTPMAVVLIALLGAIFLRRTGSISVATVTALAGIVGFTLLSGGPSLRSWLLTGDHRFRPPSRHVTTKQSIKPI